MVLLINGKLTKISESTMGKGVNCYRDGVYVGSLTPVIGGYKFLDKDNPTISVTGIYNTIGETIHATQRNGYTVILGEELIQPIN